jgi:membrane protease YdiL (CAAX protease family)
VTGLFVVLGAVVLSFSLRIQPGNDWFYLSTLVLAAVWTVGAFLSGPLHLGRTWHAATGQEEGAEEGGEDGGEDQPGPRPFLMPVLFAALLSALFVVGGLVVRQIPALDAQVQHVLDHADQGSVPVLVVITALNGVAEELFFRGALYAATTRYPVVVTTVAYAAATLATGNVMLAFAAVLLGVLVGLERRATGGILAPIITHVVWSVSMLFVLPALFG